MHDFTHMRNGGCDIGRMISKERDDIIYLGPDLADVKIGKLKIRLFHGAGGKAYSKGYKMQRYIETIPENEKPNICLMGHFHDAFFMEYQGIQAFQVPALIDQTPFARRSGLPNLKGCWWVDVNYDLKGNPVTVSPVLETFGEKRLVRK